MIGVNGALLGNVIGIEADFGYAPGFFQSGDESLVRGNSATTLTGNVIIAVPRHVTEYTLGPYFVAGVGLMHAHIDDVLGVLPVSRTLPAMDIGGGVTGLSVGADRTDLGVTVFPECRRARSGIGVERWSSEQLSFWRASMGLVIRY